MQQDFLLGLGPEGALAAMSAARGRIPAKQAKAGRGNHLPTGSSKPGIVPTLEQEAVVRCDLSKGQFVLIDAFAGAGKTSTFEFLTRANEGKRFLYLCYNKELADAAKARFPANVDCKTSHALAYGPVGWRYKKKLGNLRAVDVRAELNLSDLKDATAVLESLNNFLFSAHAEITIDHMSGPLDDREWLVPLVKKLWGKIIDQNDSTPMPHDGYLKLWAISNPDLSRYDVLLLDESQDANPLLLSLILSQWKNKTCAVVLVGDRHQSIYLWRRASNAMEYCDGLATQKYTLTESFRFTQGVADFANVILGTFKGEKNRLVGRGKGIRPLGPSAFLSRTNSGLIERAIESVADGLKINFAATTANADWSPYLPYKFHELLDVLAHMSGESGSVRTPYLQRYRSWNDILEAVEGDSVDQELKTMVDTVSRYKKALPRIINQITGACVAPDKADICFSSGHRSKGKEWAQTELNTDFLPVHDPLRMEELKKKLGKPEFAQEANLLYVAVTRTKSRVTLPVPMATWFNKEIQIRGGV